MLKLAFNDSLEVVIVENDRGCWEATTNAQGLSILEGYGGENVVTVVPMTMQDKSMDIVLVHSSCDSPSKTAQKWARNGFDPEAYNDILNELAQQVKMLDPLE